MTEDEAYSLFQKFSVGTKKMDSAVKTTTKTSRGSKVGQYIVVFRNHGIPFYMTPVGYVTELWRESQTYSTVDDARNLILDLMHAKQLSSYDYREVRGRRKDDPWDRAFLIYIKTARIHLIERESPERWSINEETPIFSGRLHHAGVGSAN